MLHWQANNDKREALKKHILTAWIKVESNRLTFERRHYKFVYSYHIMVTKALEEMTENKKSSHSLEDWNIDELKLNSQ